MLVAAARTAVQYFELCSSHMVSPCPTLVAVADHTLCRNIHKRFSARLPFMFRETMSNTDTTIEACMNALFVSCFCVLGGWEQAQLEGCSSFRLIAATVSFLPVSKRQTIKGGNVFSAKTTWG